MNEQQNGLEIDKPQALHVTFNHYLSTLKNEPAQTQITLTSKSSP